MARSKPPNGPGTDPLGHSPFSKVKLEGPKKHHDYHGVDASVPGHGDGNAVPSGHWEKEYSMSPYANEHSHRAAFLPKTSKDRPQPHFKVNETDH